MERRYSVGKIMGREGYVMVDDYFLGKRQHPKNWALKGLDRGEEV